MTLPLVSYGGSSTIAQCFAIGLLLAITRRNPFLSRDKFDLRGALEKEATMHDRRSVPGISRHYVLAAGGTGGHLMPAFALAHALERRGHHVALITDERGAAIPGKPDFLTAHVLPAGRFGKNPLSWFKARCGGAGRAPHGHAAVRNLRAERSRRVWRLSGTARAARRAGR